MRPGARFITAIAGATTAAAAIAGLRDLLRRAPVPGGREFLATAGLRAPVEILIDRSGVPHLYAAGSADLFFAQGYVHARDRFWQMELNRRIARGTLAELFGTAVLDTDRFLRRLGFARHAERDLRQLDPESRARLDAYTAGVNAYLGHHRAPLEFTLLRARPKAWRETDTLAFGRYMAWTQTANWETELIRARLLARLGPERVAALEPGDPASGVPAGGGLGPAEPGEAAREAARALRPLAGLHAGASNNWVVAPERSVTGHPLLANDPHLYPRIPAVWYVAHLHGDGFDVAGATLPGVPGVITGHNDRIAWGITAGMADCEDLFLELPDPQHEGRFLFHDSSEEAAVLHEVFQVRGRREPFEEDVMVTRHGPILNGTLDIPPDGTRIALRSVLQDWPNPVGALFQLNRATDWSSFRTALRSWAFPCLNFVYADVEGNIGYRLAGKVPTRARGDGYAPAVGWTGEYEWTGYVPDDDMPEAFNPPDGFFATANSRPAAPSRHFLARDWIDDSRWRRIVEHLRSRSHHTLDDFARIQADVVSLPAREIVAWLKPQTFARPLHRKAAAYLRAWNGMLTPESVAATIYHAFRLELLRTLNPDLATDLLQLVEGRGLDPLIAPVSAFYFRASTELVARLQHADPAVVEAAFRAAVERLRRELGHNVEAWQWGRVHRMTFAHPIGLGVPALDRALRLSRGPIPVGGDADTVAQAGVDPWHPFAANAFMVSYRQLFDVGDWDAGRFILPLGQSGHPGSPHYDDMLEAWRKVEYRPLPFTRAAVVAAAAETILLAPD
ncbi:MAG TPA: penicillin acylase family protein [Candidatus Limnocylindrales bacterium]|nr:penicillin acylase family protein [Candidatus Limnocylindrales bacterium]